MMNQLELDLDWVTALDLVLNQSLEKQEKQAKQAKQEKQEKQEKLKKDQQKEERRHLLL